MIKIKIFHYVIDVDYVILLFVLCMIIYYDIQEWNYYSGKLQLMVYNKVINWELITLFCILFTCLTAGVTVKQDTQHFFLAVLVNS